MGQRRLISLITALMIAAAGSPAGAATGQTGPRVLPDPMDFGVDYEMLAFEAADTDGNNLIDEGEFTRDAAAAFSGLDRNRDGKLTPEELGPHQRAKFDRVDGNRDGVLTFNEVMTFKMKAFKAADKDNDQALSFDEIANSVKSD